MAGTGKVKLFKADGKRLDGRAIDELRPVRMEVGVLPQASGSAYIEHGNNKIMVAAYGPREIRPKHLARPEKLRIRAEYRLATFSVNERKSPAPRRREHELSKIISEALEPSVFLERFPRSTVDLFILVLDADGGTRAASITAASLALADAGLPLRGLVSSVAAGKVGGKIVLDLSDVEDKEGEGDLPVAIINQNQEITLCQLDGQFEPDEAKEAITLAMKGCDILYQMQKDVLLKKYQQQRDEIVKDVDEDDSLENAVEQAATMIPNTEVDNEEKAEGLDDQVIAKPASEPKNFPPQDDNLDKNPEQKDSELKVDNLTKDTSKSED